MRKISTAALGLISLVASGCTGDGLSPRESSTSSLPAVMYQPPKSISARSSTATLVTGDEKITVTTRPTMSLPIRAGVVQMGEMAPPQRMVDAFRKHSDLFAVVEPMPGIFPQPGDGFNPTAQEAQQIAARNLLQVRKAAGEMGLNYVLVYGGTIDQTQRPMPWEILDITILGMFIVPSEQMDATGKAAGTLIDVESGQIVLSVSVDAKGGTMQPTAMAESVKESINNGVRDQLIDNMTNQTINRLSDRHGKTLSMKTAD